MSESVIEFPYSQEAEEAVIGSVLLDDSVYQELTGVLSPLDFFLPRHQYVWEAFNRIAIRKEPIDIITVSDELRITGRYVDSGGDAYLTHLLTNIPTSFHVGVYGSIVKKNAVRRAFLKLADDIKNKVMDSGLDITTLMGEIANGVKAIELPQTAPTFQDTLLAYVKERESLWENPDQQNGYSWGYPLFDKSWGLLKPSHFILVLGIANSGKSLFVATVLDKLITAKVRTGFITLEMQNSEVLDRLTTIRTGYDFDEERVKQDPMARRAMLKYWGELYESPIELSDKPVSIDDIPTRVYEWERLSGERIKVLIVDYTTLVRPSKRMEKAQGHEKFADISAQLKIIANELGICIIGVGQLNRGAYGDSAPELEDVGKSLAFTQDPNMILAIQRGNEENPNIMTIHHLKARSKAKSAPIDLLQDGLQLKVISYTQTPPKGY